MERQAKHLYRNLPQVGEFLDDPRTREMVVRYSRMRVAQAARALLSGLRRDIAAGLLDGQGLQTKLERMHDLVGDALKDSERNGIQETVNATGVILQTNLGRAPLSEAAVEAVACVARGYCNLEYDLESGERGRRGGDAEEMLLRALGRDESEWGALIVNNCAAATFLALNTLAEGGEVIVSRGELVEIGGGFRVPDILRKSGVRLREVGTTNRTRIEDYAAAIDPETRLILRVHRSNFEIVGFTQQPEVADLVRLGAAAGLPVFEDQGTGCLIEPEGYGLGKQSTFARSAGSGVSLVSASGDKLLGGPQCGLLAGDRTIIGKLRANPLYRALRADKMTYAALRATLLAYIAGEPESLPVMHMLRMTPGEVRARCEVWADVLRTGGIETDVVLTESVVGGGTTPGTAIPSFAVALEVNGSSPDRIAAHLRAMNPPVVARIYQDRVLLDLRTVAEQFDRTLPGLVSAQLNLLRADEESNRETV